MNAGARAFSLVEVVLALGIVGFALLAIIGLLPIGLQSGRASIQETRANYLADQVFATMRSQPFTAVAFGALASTAAPVDLSATPAPVQLHATYEGNFVAGDDYFKIDLTFLNPPAGLTAGTANEVHLQITPRESGTRPLSYATIIAAQ